MALLSPRRLEPLERRSPTLFLLAGPMVATVIVLETINQFATLSLSNTVYWPLLPLGFALSLAGLIGLYPRLVQRARRSATVGLGLGLVCLILFAVGFVLLLATRPAGPYPRNLGPIGAPFFFEFLIAIPAIGVYGWAGLRSETPSRRIGALLLALALVQLVEKGVVLFVVPLSDVSPTGTPYMLYMIVGYAVPMAVTMIAIGYSLRTDFAATARGEATDAPP